MTSQLPFFRRATVTRDIINGSSLTTERERAYFKARVQTFLDLHLPTAPREQLESIEREMLNYRPVADHRK
jgi:hypothetical protein